MFPTYSTFQMFMALAMGVLAFTCAENGFRDHHVLWAIFSVRHLERVPAPLL